MKRTIIINWRWWEQANGTLTKQIEINNNDIVVQTQYANAKDFNEKLSSIITTEGFYIVFTHCHNNQDSTKISIEKNAIEVEDRRNFKTYNFSSINPGENKAIYAGSDNIYGGLIKETAENNIETAYFNEVWNYFCPKGILELECAKRRLINAFQWLSLDIAGLSDVSDQLARQSYINEIVKSINLSNTEPLSQDVKNSIEVFYNYDKPEFDRFKSAITTLRITENDLINWINQHSNKENQEFFPKLLFDFSKLPTNELIV